MFKTVKRIIDWCGEFKGKLYLGFVMTFFSHIFAALPLIQPDRDDHIAAAALRNTCRRAGVQIGLVVGGIIVLIVQQIGRMRGAPAH